MELESLELLAFLETAAVVEAQIERASEQMSAECSDIASALHLRSLVSSIVPPQHS